MDPIGSNMEKADSAWRTHPFVTIGSIVCSVDIFQIQIDHSRRVCAVDEGIDIVRIKGGDDFLDGKYASGTAWYVINDCEASSRRDMSQDFVQDDLWRS